MDERTVQFRVGVMVLATIIILAILLLLFGDLRSLVKGTRTLYFEFPQAPGITSDSPIRVNGILVGRVRSVELSDKGGVLITARIEDKYVLRKNQMGRIGGSLLGDAVIEIVPGDQTKPPEPLKDGDTMQGIVAKDPFQAITNLEASLSVALDSIARTSGELGVVAERTNRILEANEPQINRIIANAEQSLAQLRSTLNGADTMINDPMIRANLSRAIEELPRLMNDVSTTISGVKTTMQLADRNLTNLEGLTKPLGERGPSLVAGLDRAVSQVDGLLKQVGQFTGALTNSQGTLARLVNDPALYDQVASAIANLNQISRDVKPILEDVKIFTDKLARHPEIIGARGALSPSSGIK